MGRVFEAERDNPRRSVALKGIRPGCLTPSSLRRLEFESQVLGRLQHPGIAQIFEAGTAGTGSRQQPFFAMEIVRGQSLRRYADSPQLDSRGRLSLIVRVCDAVQHAHQKGVIHRDLKPANILVDKSGQPKILDFGVARASDSDWRKTTIETTAAQLIGTIPYMSPEQVSGDPDALDTRSDVYALGVVTYELLAGRRSVGSLCAGPRGIGRARLDVQGSLRPAQSAAGGGRRTRCTNRFRTFAAWFSP